MKNKPTLMNPFPGLRSFRSDEDYLFFGRDEQALELVARLQQNRFIAVVGTSGQGKSSLVRCGLLSRLQGGGMVSAGAHWEIAIMHPGGNPFRQAADALLDANLYDREADDALPQLLATLRRSRFGLVEAVRQAALPAGTNFLLVVDQFEEIFRYEEAGAAESEEANDFIAMLREACAQSEVPVYVVTTMRSDFIGDCAKFEGLAEAVNRGEYLIPRLSRDQFKAAIEGPIRVAGGQITPRLLQRLLNDLGEQQDQLPCLQHALMRTWRGWQHRADVPALDLEDYAQVGKMSQALSVHADEVFNGLASDRQRELCAAMFKALTVEGSEKRGIRRPRRLETLCRILDVEAAELRPVIDAFRDREVSFLMPPMDVPLSESTIIDLSHESLMRVWTRLRDWVDEEAKSVGVFRRLSESAGLWGKGETGLCRDPELSIARGWAESTKPNASWAQQYEGDFEQAMAYLQASIRAAEAEARRAQRRQRLVVATLATAVVGLCIAGVFGLRARTREFQRMSRADVVIASRALGEGNVADGLAYLLRAAKRDAHNSEIAPRLASLLTSRKFQLPEAPPLELGSRIRSIRYSADQTKITAITDDGLVAVVNGATGAVTRNQLAAGLGGSFGVISSGRCAVVFGRDGVIRLVDRETAEVLKEFRFEAKLVAAWSTADDRDPVTFALLEDQTVVVCRNRAGPGMLSLLKRDPKSGFDMSADGKWLYVMPDYKASGAIEVWNAEVGGKVSEFRLPRDIASFRASRDGTRMLIRARQTDKILWQMYSLPEGRPLNELSGLENGAGSSASYFDESGKRFLVQWPGALRVYDTATLQPAGPDIKAEVTASWFNPEGTQLFVHAEENSWIYDIATGKSLVPVMATRGRLASVRFTRDGRRVSTTTAEGEVRVWDTATGELLGEPTIKVPQVVSVMSDDGEHLALGSGTGRVYRMRVSRGAAQPLVLPPNERLQFSDRGAELQWTAGKELHSIDVASGAETAPPITLPSALAPGQQVAQRGKKDMMVVHRGGTSWEVWRIAAGKITEVIPLKSGPPRATLRELNPSGTRMVFGYDQRARVWDLSTGDPVGPEMTFSAPVTSVRIMESGERYTVSTMVGTVSVIEAATGRTVIELKGLRDVTITTTRLGAKDTRVATANDWGEIQIWNTATGEPLSPAVAQSRNVALTGFSADGKLLLTHFGRVANVWDGVAGTPAASPMLHPTRINRSAIAGGRVATAAEDGVRLWDALTARPVCEPMLVPAVRFTTVSQAPNRRFVRAAGRQAGTAFTQHFIWSVPPPAEAGAAVPDWLIDLASACASRSVDADDRFADAASESGKLEAVRRKLAALPPDAPYAEWGRWFLSEEPERSIAPGFSITPAGAQRLRERLGAAGVPAATNEKK